jgi:hypothetical protein
MYNLFPGQGMGFTANRLLAFGLGVQAQRKVFVEFFHSISKFTRTVILGSRLR